MKFLVVDDAPEMRELLAVRIEWAFFGSKVYTASDGKSGLEMAKAIRPDIVVTDRHMPVMDGEDMARNLLGMNPLLPIFLLTGDTGSIRNPGLFLAIVDKEDVMTFTSVLRRYLPATITHSYVGSSCL